MTENFIDTFVGRKFGEDGHLEVLSRSDKKSGNNFKYNVLCHKCKLDPELFGNGVFLSVRHSLIKGLKPCGCGKSTRWSPRQFQIRVERKCNELGYKLISFKDGKVSSNTKVTILCNKHKMSWSSTSVVALLMRDSGCPRCKADSTSIRCRKSDEETSEMFTNTGKFAEGTTFRRTTMMSNKGVYYWEVFCPVCSTDGDGISYAFSSNLAKGCIPCNCAPRTGFKRVLPASLYVLRFTSQDREFTGFGVTNDLKTRMSAHKKNLSRSGYVIAEIEVFNENGNVVLELEKLLKKSFPITAADVQGFKTEATYYHLYYDIIEFIEKELGRRNKK